MLPVSLIDGALELCPDIDRAVVSTIPMRNEIYLALLDKRHAVAVDVVVAVVARSIHVRNHLAKHSHRTLHSPHSLANRTSAIHDYTSIRLCSSRATLRQTRTHNIVNSHLDVDNSQTLRDTQRCRMLLSLLDSRPTIVLLSTAAAIVPVFGALQIKRKTKTKEKQNQSR